MIFSQVLQPSHWSLPRFKKAKFKLGKKNKAKIAQFYKIYARTVAIIFVALLGAWLYGQQDFGAVKSLPLPRQKEVISLLGPEKPKPKKAPTATIDKKTTCDESFMNADIQFSQCPDWLVNFQQITNGPLSKKYFTAYVGAPEANQEAQYYTNSSKNLLVKDGKLVLTARLQQNGQFQYTSARITTENKKSFQYGKLVIRARMPNSIGAWPAIWMLSQDKKYSSLSPDTDFSRYRNDGEIDIAETAGVEPHKIYGIAHSRAYEPGHSSGYYSTVMVPTSDVQYHDYSIEWTPSTITFLVDGIPYYTRVKLPDANYTTWPFDQHYYLIINLALGGNWAGNQRGIFPPDGVDKSALPASMDIQSVSYYKLAGTK